MKTVQNPTQYFFEQANNPPTEYLEKINDLVGRLLNLKQCVLCKSDFNMKDRLPRILIHCGHTICHSCLLYFYRNRRVRCPLCLKLIKHLDSVERLPINHTIFTNISNEINAKSKQMGGAEILKPQEFLFTQFQQQAVQAQKIKEQNAKLKIDPETGLEFCEYHNERVKHFFCMFHKLTCCRVCVEMLHQKSECAIVELYEVEDPQEFLKQAMAIDDEEKKSKDEENDDDDDDDDDDDNELKNKLKNFIKDKNDELEGLKFNELEKNINYDELDDDFEDMDEERGSANSI